MGHESIVAKRTHLTLRLFARNHRFALWMLLVLLTAIILLFPVHLTYEYRPVQSLYIFDNLLLFGALFYIWLLSLLLLLFSGGSEARTDWEKVALVCISALVFLAFWVIILPYGRFDFISNAALVKLIQQDEAIPLGRALYSDFPASHLMVLSLSEVTGLGVFDAVNLFLVCIAPIFAALLYLLFTKAFKSTSVAAFAALMLMLGNQFLSRGYTFWPGIPSLVLLLAFLVLLTRGQHALLETWQDRLIAIILLVATTAMYFQTSILLLLILVGIHLVQRLSKMTPVAISTICLFAVIPMAWEIYWTVQTFPALADFASKMAEDIAGGTFLEWVPFLAEGNVGERFPLWVNVIRIFWWALIFGLGSLLGLRNLLRFRELSLVERIELGGLLSVIMLAAIATLVSPGGERFVHFLHYAAFFTVPVLLRTSLNLGKRIKGYGFALLVILLLILSFPTFLVFNNRISTDTFYSYEMSAGEFLERSYGNGEGLTVVNPYVAVMYYVPDAYPEMGYWYPGHSRTEDEFWQRVDDIVEVYSISRGGHTLFMMHDRLKVLGEFLIGISSSDPYWQVVENRIKDELIDNSNIYDSGYAQIYQ
jgi:hypothetical protein